MHKLEFKFPLTVSCVHFICSSIGTYITIKVLKIKPLIEVAAEDRWKRIFPMSFVFCMNIVLGNVSLRYIPVSFMQTIKSSTPATTVGCLATSTKTILAESLLHGYKFDSINTVYYMAPFATMILSIPAIVLEGSGVIKWLYTYDSTVPALIIIITSGVLAFCLNFSIFYVIHLTTGVTFNIAIAGNLKVAVAVLICWMIFRNPISEMNAVGWDHARRLHLLRLREESDLPAGLLSQPTHSEKPAGDAPPRRRKAAELASGVRTQDTYRGAHDNHRNNEKTDFRLREALMTVFHRIHIYILVLVMMLYLIHPAFSYFVLLGMLV